MKILTEKIELNQALREKENNENNNMIYNKKINFTFKN